MSGIHNYGVLKGRVVGARPERDRHNPHFQIRVRAAGRTFQVPVNVRSMGRTPELLYLIDDDFRHPLTGDLRGLAEGFHPVAKEGGGVALDYIRGNLFDRERMEILPHDAPGDDDDLNDKLAALMRRAMDGGDATVYAFGSAFPGHGRPRGVHNVHMNQGNPRGHFDGDNGVFQDGALLVHFGRRDRWTAVFLAFQSQAWHTDPATGHPRAEAAPGRDVHAGEPDKRVRIVAALVNPTGPDGGRETITLLNATRQAINLKGWKILNREAHEHRLSGTLRPHAPLVVRLPEKLALGNNGGTITLLNDQGLKVHGVSYTQTEADREGRQLVF